MMLNSRDDINQIINNIGGQKEIETIRIYNKQGQIKFSNKTAEVDSKTNIEAEACYICHRSDPPLTKVALAKRTRIFSSPHGYRLLGIISPIANLPDCSTAACHVVKLQHHGPEVGAAAGIDGQRRAVLIVKGARRA